MKSNAAIAEHYLKNLWSVVSYHLTGTAPPEPTPANDIAEPWARRASAANGFGDVWVEEAE